MLYQKCKFRKISRGKQYTEDLKCNIIEIKFAVVLTLLHLCSVDLTKILILIKLLHCFRFCSVVLPYKAHRVSVLWSQQEVIFDSSFHCHFQLLETWLFKNRGVSYHKWWRVKKGMQLDPLSLPPPFPNLKETRNDHIPHNGLISIVKNSHGQVYAQNM